MRQGLHLSPRDLRALPAAPPDRAARLESLGRSRFPRADTRAQEQIQVRQPRRRRVHPDLLGRRVPEDGPGSREHLQALQRRGGRRAPPRPGLPAGDGRGDGWGRDAHDQDARRHGAAGGAGQVRHVSPVQLARPARRQDPRRRTRQGPRRPHLVQLHLARRPGPRPPLGARPPGLGLRLQRPALLEADHHGRQEPGGEQAHRFPLVHRVHGAGRQDRGDRARVRAALDQSRLLDPHPAGDRHRSVARHHPADDREGLVRRGVRQDLHRLSAARAARQPAAAQGARGLPGLSHGTRPRRPVDEDPGPDRRAARPTGRLRHLGRDRRPPAGAKPRRRGRGDDGHGPRPGPWGKLRCPPGQRPHRPLLDPVDSLPDPPEGLRPRHGLRHHQLPAADGGTAGRGHRHHGPGGDPPGRGNQPLVPRHRDEPRRLPAADAHRQHRQAGRWLPHLGR